MSKSKVIIEDIPEINEGKLEDNEEQDIVQDIKRTKISSAKPKSSASFAKPKPLVKKVNRPNKQSQQHQQPQSDVIESTTTQSNNSNTQSNIDQNRVTKERFARLLIFLAKLDEGTLYNENVQADYNNNIKNGNMKPNRGHVLENS